jgi:hypothetical protein
MCRLPSRLLECRDNAGRYAPYHYRLGSPILDGVLQTVFYIKVLLTLGHVLQAPEMRL